MIQVDVGRNIRGLFADAASGGLWLRLDVGDGDGAFRPGWVDTGLLSGFPSGVRKERTMGRWVRLAAKGSRRSGDPIRVDDGRYLAAGGLRRCARRCRRGPESRSMCPIGAPLASNSSNMVAGAVFTHADSIEAPGGSSDDGRHRATCGGQEHRFVNR